MSISSDQTTREASPTPGMLTQWQFSLVHLLVLTVMVAVLLGIAVEQGLEWLILVVLWSGVSVVVGWFLSTAAGFPRGAIAGFVGGWLWFAAAWYLRDFLRFPAGSGFEGIALTAGFLIAAEAAAAGWSVLRHRSDPLALHAVHGCLALLGFPGILLVLLLLRRSSSLDEPVAFCLVTAAVLGSIPWWVVWRKRRSWRLEWRATTIAAVAKGLAAVAVLVPATSVLIFLLVSVLHPPPPGFDGLGQAIFWGLLILGTHAFGALLFLASVFLQWLRDRWAVTWLAPGCLYIAFCWALFFGDMVLRHW